MKLVRHLIRYELRSMPAVLGAWAGVLLLQAALLWIGPPIPMTERPSDLDIRFDVAIIVLRFVLTAVVIWVLVQRHLLVGTTAFWRTRPIPRRSVLVSTVTSAIFLTVIVPGVWFAGVFAWLGLDLPEVLRGALAIAAEQALCGAFAFVLVSVSATLAQAVVFGVATTLLWGFGIELVSAIPKRSALFTLALTEANLQWSQVIGGTVIGTAAMLIAIYQHLTLRTIRSQILIVALVVGVVLLRPFPPLAFTGDAAVAETTSSVSTPELSIDLASIRSEAYSDKTPGGTDTGIRYSALLTQSASAVPIVLKPTKVVSALTFPDGSTQQVSPRFADAWTEDDGDPLFADTPYPGIAATVGAILADSPPGTAGRYRFTFLQVREDVAAIRATQPAALDLTLHLQAYRHSLAARIPIDVGSRAGLPRHVITMVGTAALDNGIAVDIRETYISDWRPTAPTFYVLGNRRLNQAVLASSRWERLFRSATTAYSSPVVCTTRLAFLPRENSAGRVTLDRAWLEDAELLVLKPENLGRVLKSIRVENFTLARAVSAPRQP